MERKAAKTGAVFGFRFAERDFQGVAICGPTEEPDGRRTTVRPEGAVCVYLNANLSNAPNLGLQRPETGAMSNSKRIEA